MATQVKLFASFFAEKIDPKKKNARVLAPLNANEDGPFHFFAKNVIAATKTTKQEKKNVILALAHDGIKIVDVASTEKLDENAVREALGNASLHTWDTIVRFRIVGALQEFRFSWDDRSVASDDIKKRTKDFRLQTIDFDAIDQKIGKIVKDIEANKLLSSLGGGATSVRPRSGSKSARSDGSSSARKESSPRERSGSTSSRRKGSDAEAAPENADDKKKDKKKIKVTSAAAEEKPQEAEPAPEEKKEKKDKKKKDVEPEPEAEPEKAAEPEPEPEPAVEEKKKDKKKKKDAEEPVAEEAPKEEEAAPAAEEAPAEEAAEEHAEEQKDKKKKKKKKVESSEEADE